MAEERSARQPKQHPWSWHRLFLLFALTVTMILGFVVVGGGSAMMAECGKTETRRSVYLSDIVTKITTKRALLDQLTTAWMCDIPVSRLSGELVTASGRDGMFPCESDLLVQLVRGGQGALAAGVLLVLASGAGYGGAISARSGPLAMYIVVTVVTAILELAAIGLLVYNKSQLDTLPDMLDTLMTQPMPPREPVVTMPDVSGGLWTAPGEVPTLAPRSGGVTAAEGQDLGGVEPTVVVGGTNGTEEELTSQRMAVQRMPVLSEVTSSVTNGVKGSTKVPQKTDTVPAEATASSSPSSASSSPPYPISSTSPLNGTVEGRQAAETSTNIPELVTGLPVTQSAALSNHTHPSTSRPTASTEPSSNTSAPAPDPSSQRRRHSEEFWREEYDQGDDWSDHTEEVIGHWATPATDCLHADNRSHCYTKLEHNLQRELAQSELVLELMMAPLVCAFLACLLQLTTICAAWSMITDQQTLRRRARGPAQGQELNTPV